MIDQDVVQQAVAVAARAASDAGVDIRAADELAEVAAVRETLGDVWADPQHLVPRELLRAISRFGGVLLGAWDADTCVGGSLGFFGEHDGMFRLHSHTTAVADTHRGRHVGLGLKLAQRVRALQAGVEVVTWTFDPLLRANARFNLERLGAVGVGYEPDFYGPRDDVFNAGDLTDRLVLDWRVARPEVQARAEGEAAPTPPPTLGDQILVSDRDGWPTRTHPTLDRTRPAWVATPEGAVSLRRTDPELARAWRLSVRDALVEALDAGWVVAGFAEGGWLRLVPERSFVQTNRTP
ncbi:MAG TPA: hypothetical protein VGA36_07430 [Nitriliruptorales bacterium]